MTAQVRTVAFEGVDVTEIEVQVGTARLGPAQRYHCRPARQSRRRIQRTRPRRHPCAWSFPSHQAHHH